MDAIPLFLMKVAIIQPPAYGVRTPPLGPAYLASSLEKAGIECRIFDFNSELYKNGGLPELWNPENLAIWQKTQKFCKIKFSSEEVIASCARQVLEFAPDVIGMSVHNPSANFSIALAKAIKAQKNDAIIIMGGPICHPNLKIFPEMPETDYNIHEYADYLVVGEGEKTFIELLDAIAKGKNPAGCKGIMFRKGEKLVFTGNNTPIMTLDLLPFPDFSQFPLDNYRHYEQKSLILPIMLSRGCTNHCVFCTDTNAWFPYRFRFSKSVIDEIKSDIEQYGCTAFEFNDSLINGNPKLLSDVCEEIIREKIQISWSGSARADSTISKELLQKMKKAGCNTLYFGIESGSQKVLNNMRKNINIRKVPKILKWASELGISVGTSWIIGFPTETEEDFKKTVKFIRDNRKYITHFSVQVFFINHLSDVEKNFRKYKIVPYREDWGFWRTEDDSNTFEVRKKRLRFLNEEIQKNFDYARIIK